MTALTVWRGFGRLFELIEPIQRQNRRFHGRTRGVLGVQAADARAVDDRGKAVHFQVARLAGRDGGGDAHGLEVEVVALAQSDDGDAPSGEGVIARVVNDAHRGWLTGDLALGDQLRDLAAQRGVDGARGAARLCHALEQVDHQQGRVDLGNRPLPNTKLHHVSLP